MEKTPFAGQLNRKVTINKVTLVPNEISEHKETTVQVAQPYAIMKEGVGGLDIEGKVVAEVQRTYTIRRYAEIAANGTQMTLVDGGVVFRITRVKELDRSHLELSVVAYE